MLAVRRVVPIIGSIQFFVVFELSLLFPLGPMLAQTLGFPVASLGYLNGAFLAAACLSGLAGSLCLDRFDRRLTLVIALAGLSVGTALAAFATDLWTLAAARTVAGLFGGPAVSLSLAFVADAVSVEERGRAMSAVSIGSAVAIVAGVPLGMQVSEWLGWRWMFVLAGGLGLLLAGWAFAFLPRGFGRGEGGTLGQMLREFGVILRRRTTLVALCCTTMIIATQTVLATNLATVLVFNLGYPQTGLKYLWMVGGAFGLLGSQSSGRLADRIGAMPILWVASLLAAVVFFLMFVSGSAAVPVMVLFCGFNIAVTARHVIFNTVISMVPGPGERARFMSLLSAVNQAVSAVAVVGAAAAMHTAPGGRLIGIEYAGLVAVACALLIPVLTPALRRA